MIPKCGWEMKKAMCARFVFVQPGVVSTCSVTERISFFLSFAAVFRKGVLEFVWNVYLGGPFLRHVSKGMWGCDCWVFWTEFGVPFFSRAPRLRFCHFVSIFDFAHHR